MEVLKNKIYPWKGPTLFALIIACLIMPHFSESFLIPVQSVTGLLFHKVFYLIDTNSSPSTSGIQETFGIRDPTNQTEKRLCPEGEAFHNATSTCHKVLEKGPCGDLQLFYYVKHGQEGSNYGTCACMSNDDGCNPIVKSNRMILAGPDGRHCYWAYSSGPCPDGQWYVLNMKTRKPECQRNPCFTEDGLRKPDPFVGKNEIVLGMGNGETDKFTFELNNTCYDTYTQGYCGDGEYVQFLGTTNPFPKCFSVAKGPPFCLFGVAPVAGMPCDAGYKLVGDDCVMANIDFE